VGILNEKTLIQFSSLFFPLMEFQWPNSKSSSPKTFFFFLPRYICTRNPLKLHSIKFFPIHLFIQVFHSLSTLGILLPLMNDPHDALTNHPDYQNHHIWKNKSWNIISLRSFLLITLIPPFRLQQLAVSSFSIPPLLSLPPFFPFPPLPTPSHSTPPLQHLFPIIPQSQPTTPSQPTSRPHGSVANWKSNRTWNSHRDRKGGKGLFGL